MTYCLAIRVDRGIVFASDTRTNAGVDYVTSYRKLHVFEPAEDRAFVLQSSGNLATTQEVLDRLWRDLDATDGRESLRSVAYLFEAAKYIGRVVQDVQNEYAAALGKAGVNGETTLIMGGQIRGAPQQIFLVYPQGNFIEASNDTPYFQIGESKYGKPMLDRMVSPVLSLEQAARLAIVSLDATVRSNITVGPPFDMAIYERDSFRIGRQLRIENDSPYYTALREAWKQGLSKAFGELPPFEWELPG